MGIEDLLILKGISELIDWINDIEFSMVKGILTILVFLVILWILLYILLYGFYIGYWERNLWIIGIWLFLELAYFIGGGHNSRW